VNLTPRDWAAAITATFHRTIASGVSFSPAPLFWSCEKRGGKGGKGGGEEGGEEGRREGVGRREHREEENALISIQSCCTVLGLSSIIPFYHLSLPPLLSAHLISTQLSPISFFPILSLPSSSHLLLLHQPFKVAPFLVQVVELDHIRCALIHEKRSDLSKVFREQQKLPPNEKKKKTDTVWSCTLSVRFSV
jgi:hypothetical protein